MKKLAFLAVVLLTALAVGLMVGCGDEGNPLPPETDGGVASIELQLQFDQISGLEGEQRTDTVTATAKNSQGVAVKGARIQFALESVYPFPDSLKGTIAPAGQDTLTNADGRFFGVYSVRLASSGGVTIRANSGTVTAARTLTLQVVEIGGVSLEAAKVLTVAPNQVKQTTITATVQDTQGVGVSGLVVHFRTDPTYLGTVDSETRTTDFNGRVSNTFSTVVGHYSKDANPLTGDSYGPCRIYAWVGQVTAVAAIDIRGISEPENINLFPETLDIKITGGENRQIDDFYANVTDVERRGVPGVAVEFTVEPFVPGGVTFGSVSITDTLGRTDASGFIHAVFNTLGSDGRVWIKAMVVPEGVEGSSPPDRSGSETVRLSKGGAAVKGKVVTAGADQEISARSLLTVERVSDVAWNLNVYANPRYLHIAPDTIGFSMVMARVTDSDGRGTSDVSVDFTTDIGSLARATPTDSSGVAQVEFRIQPNIDFPNPEDREDTAHVTASLPGTNLSKTVAITVEKFSSLVGTLGLYKDTDVIYADNGVTKASLTALLKDADGQVMAGKDIIFTSDFGSVNSPVPTDTSGIARAVFTDIGLPSVDPNGTPVPARIVAKYTPMGLATFVDIWILEPPPIAEINLTGATNSMIAGRGDSCEVTARCVQENGQPAPDGREVVFRIAGNRGRFSQERVYTSNSQGTAITQYIPPSTTGLAVLTATVYNPGGDSTVSNEWVIQLLPGPPSRIRLTAVPDRLDIQDPAAISNITASVADTANNPVESGNLVIFTTTLGTVLQFAITDSTGRAYSTLRPGVVAGVADVAGTVQGTSGPIEGHTTVTFASGLPNAIDLEADPLEIQVAGTGGISSSRLKATVKDAMGNLVETPSTVIFELLRQPPVPQGCNINNRGQTDSALTSNGVAYVTLNAGTRIGSVLIRAYTWRDPDTRLDIVEVTNSSVQVVSGPPWVLDIDVNEAGTNLGGGTWAVEVSVRISDFHRNPVKNNIPVVFSVDPDIANIDPGSTGNVNRDGQTNAGVAYSDMIYQSDNTFDTLTIIAVVETEEGVREGRHPHVLPLQQGEIQLNVSPINWMFDRLRPNDACLIRVWALLIDNHQVLINNGPVLFTTTRSTFYWQDFRNAYHEYAPPAPAVKYTGWRAPEHPEYIEEDGVATVFLRGIMSDFFLDDFTLEVTVTINSSVVGYDDVSSDPGFVFMTRH